MPVDTSSPVAGQTKTSVPIAYSMTRPRAKITIAIRLAVQDGSGQRNKREAPALSGGLIAAMALGLQVDQLLGRALIN